ncbi:antibiotic biosynthesis monooxygenase [Candidatus Peregrinibacteria bacterium]|nr:antibiotic biosynthesis monooxygenase [Candidatus Peregrinibacteria bacterium]
MLHYMATYQVKKEALDEVKQALIDFVGSVKDNEPNTIFYTSFHKKDDPLSFIHFVCFENEEAKNFHEAADYTKAFMETLSHRCSKENIFTELDMIRSNKVC